MFDRDGGEYADLVNVGVLAMVRSYSTAQAVEAIIDLAEPIIRADEREKIARAMQEAVAGARRMAIADERERIATVVRTLKAEAVGREYRYALEDVLDRIARNGGQE